MAWRLEGEAIARYRQIGHPSRHRFAGRGEVGDDELIFAMFRVYPAKARQVGYRVRIGRQEQVQVNGKELGVKRKLTEVEISLIGEGEGLPIASAAVGPNGCCPALHPAIALLIEEDEIGPAALRVGQEAIELLLSVELDIAIATVRAEGQRRIDPIHPHAAQHGEVLSL